MSVNIEDVKKWHEEGLVIMAAKEKLDNKAAGKLGSPSFLTLYYGLANTRINRSEIDKALEALAIARTSISSSNPLKTPVGNFIEISKIAYNPENTREFKRLLKEKGWLPVDPEEEQRKAREAEEAARIAREEKKKADEQARRDQEAKDLKRRKDEERERELQREREREIRRQKEREERARRLRKVRVYVGIAAAILIIWGLAAGIPAYKYHHTEYKELMANAEVFRSESRYAEAIEALEEARVRKSSKKKIAAIGERLAQISAERDKKVEELRRELSDVWGAYFSSSNQLNYSNIQYVERSEVLPVIESTRQKIELLRTITSDQDEYLTNTAKINRLKTHFNC